MCVVSMIHDYGQRMPPNWWNGDNLRKYKRLIEDARRFDDETGQPNCEDPQKEKFLQDIMDRLERIEKKLDGTPL